MVQKNRLSLCLVIIAGIFLASNNIDAANWVTADQVSIGWNAVTVLENGASMPAEDTVRYRIYTRTIPSGEPRVVGETSDVAYMVVFQQEGRYVIGVQTVRIPHDSNEEALSSITWFDDPDPSKVLYSFWVKVLKRMVK